MALFTCPECGHQISDKAAACPHCGFPVQDYVEAKTGTYSILQEITGQDPELAAILHLAPAQISQADRDTLANRPAVVASDLTKEEAEALVAQFSNPQHFKIMLTSEIPPASTSENKPMTFESTMGAVILGVIVAALILSFL